MHSPEMIQNGDENIILVSQPELPAENESDRSLTIHIKKLAPRIELEPSDYRWRSIIKSDIWKILETIVDSRHSYLRLMGSTINYTGLSSSNLDLCLETDNDVDLVSLQNLMTEKYSEVINSKIIETKKVRILRLYTRSFSIDLCVNWAIDARHYDSLIRFYIRLDKRVRPLILAVKYWARQSVFNYLANVEISSPTLIVMLIAYLQRLEKPVLPCVQETDPHFFDDVLDGDEHFARSPYFSFSSRNTDSLGVLYAGFMKFYGWEFNFEEHIISIATTKSKDKNSVPSSDMFFVECPLQMGENLSGGVDTLDKYEWIITAFRNQFEELQRQFPDEFERTNGPPSSPGYPKFLVMFAVSGLLIYLLSRKCHLR